MNKYLFIRDGKIVGTRTIDVDFPIRAARAIRDKEYPGASIAVVIKEEGFR